MVFIVIHSRKWFLLLLVVFIARHVMQMVYKLWKAKSSCGQWNWKHFSRQPRERPVAFIPRDLFTVVEVCTVMLMTQLCKWNACSQCTNKHTETTHVRRIVSTVAQSSNSKVWVNTEWTYQQNDNSYMLNVEVERLRLLLSFSDVRSELSARRPTTLTEVFRGFPQFIKKVWG